MSATKTHSTVLSTKGQVILPKAVRDELGWTPGAKLDVETKDGAVTIRAKKRLFPVKTVDEVYGMLKYDGPPVSIEDMDRAITEEVLARHARGRY